MQKQLRQNISEDSYYSVKLQKLEKKKIIEKIPIMLHELLLSVTLSYNETRPQSHYGVSPSRLGNTW